MRRSVAIFLVVNLAVVIYLVSSVWTLLSLLVVDGSSDAISRAELPGPDSASSRKEVIPRIIHQTYVNESIPAHWQAARDSCLDLHKAEDGWEHYLWTDRKSRDFIATEFPWFLETFDGYQFPIQRADAIRYFVLAHYGGVYIDLDDGCNRRLDPLLTYPAWLRRTVPTGISNDAMGSVPRHPFFMRVIEDLQDYDKSWLMPYITVMASTGPLFLSIIWRHYNVELGAGLISGMTEGLSKISGGGFSSGKDLLTAEREMRRVRVLMPGEYQGNSWSFFTHHLGNSWHQGDVKVIIWMRDHWFLLFLLGFSIAGVVFFSAWTIYRRVLHTRSSASHISSISSISTSIRKHIPFFGDQDSEGYEMLPRGRERERVFPV